MRKRWRYVGLYSQELMFCAGSAQVGLTRQNWWAALERENGSMIEQTSFGRGAVELHDGHVSIKSQNLQVELALQPFSSMEVESPAGRGFTWTQKTLANASGSVQIAGRTYAIDQPVLLDDSAGYHPRHTRWQWSAGFGHSVAGEPVAWNLVSGINDAPENSERTVWKSNQSYEVGPVSFTEDLSEISFASGEQLHFEAEAERANNENLVLIRSNYRQPFGSFSGSLPGIGELSEGFGVTEFHDVYW